MQILFHRCGQVFDVAESLSRDGKTNTFVFLDPLTADGYDRCPKCGCDLAIGDFTCQPPAISLRKLRKAAAKPIQAEVRRLIRQARQIGQRKAVQA